MRLRNITGSREIIAEHPLVIHAPEQWKGRFAAEIFRNDHELHIEIGMGKGQFLTALAEKNPQINYIGIEKYSSVLLRALQKMEERETPLPNLRFIRMDAEAITGVFDTSEISKIYLNFSDPWPKDRHAKRRLPSRQFLMRYAQILKDDGCVEFKTDNRDLFSFALSEAPEAGWRISESTLDLHHDARMNQENIMTEYEQRFSAQGNPICKCILTRLLSLFLLLAVLSAALAQPVFAVSREPTEEQAAAAQERKKMRVETNELNGWPEGPMLGAQSAVLMDADTGAILYEKNVYEHLYPASTTKLMTALIALEHTTMDETVTFSKDSIFNIESSSSRIGIDVGEKLTMEQCLYGLLLGSANEVAYAIAEHVGGDYQSFVDMMNERAAQIGCKDTHFANANGLPREDHYTCAYDLALIARECFKNESLETFSGSTRYTLPPTNLQTEERILDNHHLMLPGFKYAYDGVICGKTGYTNDARQTLVTLAQRGEMRLICVILKEEYPDQFLDTQKLFDYGFSQFQKMNVAKNEKQYTLDSATFFHTNLDIIGSSKPILSINPNGNVVLPKNYDFSALQVAINYAQESSDYVAELTYAIDGHYIGRATIDYADNGAQTLEFANIIAASEKVLPRKVVPDHKIIFVDTNKLILRVVIVFFGAIILVLIVFLIRKLVTDHRRNRRFRERRYKRWNKKLF